jgi:hypothetical protein
VLLALVFVALVPAGGFAIAALGFGLEICTTADEVLGAGFAASCLCEDASVVADPDFAVAVLATPGLAAPVLAAPVFAVPVFATPALGSEAELFAATFFTLELLPAFALPIAFLAFALSAGFFAAADFGSSVFSVSSNAGLGRVPCGTELAGVTFFELSRVVSAAGFTPAATAIFAAEAASADCFAPPCISGLTMT